MIKGSLRSSAADHMSWLCGNIWVWNFRGIYSCVTCHRQVDLAVNYLRVNVIQIFDMMLMIYMLDKSEVFLSSDASLKIEHCFVTQIQIF